MSAPAKDTTALHYSIRSPHRRPRVRTHPSPVVPKKVTLDNLTLSRKEGFRAVVESPARQQPPTLTMRELDNLDPGQRRVYNRQRSIWHANFRTIKTPQLLELNEDVADIVESNQHDGDKAKGAIGIEAPAGVGKTSALLDFAGQFHRETIDEYGNFTEAGDERWPVCRVGMTGNTGLRDFNRAMLAFYNHAGTRSGTAADFATRALDCVLSCETKLLVVDDLHFLKQRTTSVEISNQFKYISNEFPLTIIFIGIGLKQRGLYSDGDYADGILGQSGRRITPLVMRSFDIDSAEHLKEWRQLLITLEKRIVLANKERGMLTKHWDLLFERTSGRIGPLTTLINRACHRAVRTGAEYLDEQALRRVPMDAASEQQRPDMQEKVRHIRRKKI
ncbi:AAA family ATPase [Mycolicibacterium setense]|uniref:AAA family ATPase n=1 Tax=Mycolicibacterium setense TaxID=431269 RepID=UPI0009EEEBB0|nr:AAA family ATPase [Mycolicibacterium setense]